MPWMSGWRMGLSSINYPIMMVIGVGCGLGGSVRSVAIIDLYAFSSWRYCITNSREYEPLTIEYCSSCDTAACSRG